MRRALLALAAIVVLAASLVPTPARAEPVAVVITGPTAVAPSSVHPYIFKVTGGPAATAQVGATYTINYVVQGDDTVGADPIILRTLSNAKGEFVANITAPQAEGIIQIYVQATSSDGTANETAETRLTITVALPIELRASLRNNGAATATNVTLYFFVDGNPVGNTTVARLAAGATVDVNVTYIPVGLAEGEHTVTAYADLNHDGTPQAGEWVLSAPLYKTERSVAPAIFATITVVILVILAFVLLAIRRQRRQG